MKLANTELFITEVKVKPGNQIEIYIDGDNGLAIHDCVELSRFIEKSLDREQEDFSLEVSSPGALSPLKSLRQYKKHLGRDLEIELLDGTKKEGKLIEIQETEPFSIVAETSERRNKPIGKGKILVTEHCKFELKDIKESKVKLKF